MSRHSTSFVLASLIVFLLVACGEKSQEKKPDAKAVRISRIREEANALKKTVESLDINLTRTLEQVGEDQERLARRHDELKRNLDALKDRTNKLQATLLGLAQPSKAGQAAATKGRDHGWPWIVKLILVIAVLLIIFLLYKRLTRGDESDEDDLLDEGFLEDNDLGTVRYPGERSNPKGDDPANR